MNKAKQATFKSNVGGIPCGVLVTYYQPHRPMQITGTGFGDAVAPDLEEFEFSLLDRKGYPASWLERMLNTEDKKRIFKEFKNEDC